MISNIDNYVKMLPSIKKRLDDTSDKIKELPQYVLLFLIVFYYEMKRYVF